jgi:DNA-binding transcriptional LysR family regulator
LDVHYTLRQLQYFVAVSQAGTLNEAASRCHVSPPALSLAISQLERSLGVKLLVRNRSKGTQLTPGGSRVLKLAESLLAQARDLQENADAESGGSLGGSLAVGCYTTLAPQFVPILLTGFKAECPGVTLEFSEYAQPELQRDLRKGVLELALLYDRQLDTDLDYIEVDRLYPYVLLHPSHRFAGDPAVSLAALADEPMILFDVPPSRENWLHIVHQLSIEPLVGHRTQHFELTRCLVGRGLGYALLFQRPSLDTTYEGRRVVMKPIMENIPASRIVLGYPAGTNLTARARRFAKFAVAALHARNEVGRAAPASADGSLDAVADAVSTLSRG